MTVEQALSILFLWAITLPLVGLITIKLLDGYWIKDIGAMLGIGAVVEVITILLTLFVKILIASISTVWEMNNAI